MSGRYNLLWYNISIIFRHKDVHSSDVFHFCRTLPHPGFWGLEGMFAEIRLFSVKPHFHPCAPT